MHRALPFAALVFCISATAAGAQSLVVPIDHSTRLNVAGSAASVVVGNPQVADVTVVDSHTVFVSGRGFGETDVVVLDAAGRTLYAGDILVGSPNGGRVTVYRGQARTDMACAPGCAVSFRSETRGGGSGSQGGAVPTGGGGQAGPNLASMLGGVMGAAASGVGRAMGSQPAAQ
jgi:hypothetical protein